MDKIVHNKFRIKCIVLFNDIEVPKDSVGLWNGKLVISRLRCVSTVARMGQSMIEQAGYDYDVVQQRVNELLG